MACYPKNTIKDYLFGEEGEEKNRKANICRFCEKEF